MNKKAQVGYNGLWVILIALFTVTIIGVTAGGAIIETGLVNNIQGINSTQINAMTPYSRLNTTLSTMKTSFVDENGNAKTGTSDVINALFTGVASLIGTVFQSVTTFVPVINQIGLIMHLPPQVVALSILFMILIAVVTVIFMIRRL